MLMRTLTLLMFGLASPALAGEPPVDARAQVRAALEEQATLPVRMPSLPDSAADRAQEALRVRSTRQVERAAETSSASEGAKANNSSAARPAAANASNGQVHAAEQAAAGQARAAEVKKAHKNSPNSNNPHKP